MQVVYSVSAEMVYSGSMMKYNVKDQQIFTVQNTIEAQGPVGALPETRTEMVGFRDEPRPMTLEFAVSRSVLNIETDMIEGWLRIRDMQAHLVSMITGIRVDLVQ